MSITLGYPPQHVTPAMRVADLRRYRMDDADTTRDADSSEAAPRSCPRRS